MELLILLLMPLLLYVVPDCVFIAMAANGTREITVSPKLTTPQLLFDMRTQAKYLPCCDALDQRYQLCDAVSGNRLHQKMYMILVCSYLQKFQLVTFFQLKTNIMQRPVHSIIKYSTTIFRWKHQMVYQYCNIMSFM